MKSKVLKIYKVVLYDDYEKVYCRSGLSSYYFNSDELIYSSGDIIKIEASVKPISGANLPYGFDYNNYLRRDFIFGKLEIKNIEVINKTIGINIFHEKINEYIKNNYDSLYSGYLSALTIGDKTGMDDETSNSINSIGISHLFVISGLHIELLAAAILFFLRKIKSNVVYYVTFLILVIYWIICGMTVSILRVLISFILSKILKLPISRWNKLLLNTIIILIINPYYLFKYGFLLSYSVVYGINLISKYLKNTKGIRSFLYNNLLISSMSLVISLPIISNMGSKINILSILYNLFFIPFISYYYLPLSFLTLLIRPMGVVYYYHCLAFSFLTSSLSKFNLTKVFFSHINVFFIFAYYFIIALLFSRIKKKLKIFITAPVLILFIFIWSFIQIGSSGVYFLSLPIGESTFICEKGTNILIDCGDGSTDELNQFLRHYGVRKLDAVIITHGDSDHIGGLNNLTKDFKIKKVLISYYDSSSIEQIENMKNISFEEVKGGDKIIINDIHMDVLSPNYEYRDINNNSLVLYFNLFNYNFLFTGDMEIEAEEDLIKQIKHLDVDILKVAHHGSNTSSSKGFLKMVSPKVAVAMNGYQNKYSFPAKVVVDRYKEMDIPMYNTIDYGTVYIKKSKQNSLIKLYYTNS